MARVRDMQGVPAQIEVLRSNDGHRRHPSHCIFHMGAGRARICDNPHSPIYRENCSSAKNCEYYEEEDK